MATNIKILVTGATGFIGAVLTRQLVEEGADVRILRRPDSSMELLGDVAEDVEHVVGDVTYARSLYEAMADVDHVYHVAAKVSFARRDRQRLRQVNVGGTANVVDAALAAGVDRVVHTSSMAAFGRPVSSDGVIDEDTAWRDASHRSVYARSKRRAELEVHRGIAEGLDAVIVNPSLVFGVGGPGVNTRRIVDAVYRGWLPAVPPGGTNVVDVKDVAIGHRKAMRRGKCGRRYFLGSENRSWAGIVGALADAFGVEPPRYTIPPFLLKTGGVMAEGFAALTRTRPILTRSTAQTACRTYRYDNSRACDELGCTFRSLDETAGRIARALRAAESPTPVE